MAVRRRRRRTDPGDRGGHPGWRLRVVALGRGRRTAVLRRRPRRPRATDIYAASLTGAVERVTAVADRRCILRDRSPDGRYLLFTADEAGEFELWRHDRRTGDTERLTETAWANQVAGFSPDGRRVAYPVPGDDVGVRPARRLAVADADGSDERVLDVGTAREDVLSRTWGATSERLLVSCLSDDGTRHGSYDLGEGSVDWFASAAVAERPVTYLPGAERLLAVREHELSSAAVLHGPDGDSTVLDLPGGVVGFPPEVSAPTVSLATGDLLVGHETTDTPPRLCRYDRSTAECEPVLGGLDADGATDVVSATAVAYESLDGLEIHGLCYDAGDGRAPGVVRVKGGPDGRITRRFDPFVQTLVRRGYTVFEPNYRGSDGRGRAFSESVRGDIGGGDAADVAAAGRWLAGREGVDGDRIGVFGHSHGAYLVLMAMARWPSVFDAGVARNGYTDHPALDDEHARAHVAWLLGDRAENEALWRERSPVTHVEKLRRPLLVLHAENDWIPIAQARRFREALESRGWTAGEEFEYAELGDQGHSTSDPQQLRSQWDRVLDFFDSRL